jgi:hypothetical protein
MLRNWGVLAIGLALVAGSTANGQVVAVKMGVTNTHMS